MYRVKIVGIIPARFAGQPLALIAARKQIFIMVSFVGLLPWLVCSGDASLTQRRSPDQVLLVCNTNSAVSRAIAGDYARKRHIKNMLPIQCQDSALSTTNETIALAAYTQSIEN